MKSIWTQTTHFPERKLLPDAGCSAQAVVIGAGLAGILTAWYLQEQGLSVIVLEASRTGSGQTSRTSAKITSQHSLIYDKLIRQFGERKARQYADANQQAIERYRKLVDTLSISCEFTDCPAYLYTTEDDEPLKRELEAARRLGIDAAFTTNTSLPFPVKGALKFFGQAHFHPLLFLEAVAKEVTVYEHTRVLNVKGNQVFTNHGAVTAEHIIFATHYPFINVPGFYFLRMHQERSYLLALKPGIELDGTYLSIDQGGYSFRNYRDMTLLGGCSHRTGSHNAGCYESLRQTAGQYLPAAREAAYWSAQDCMTLDGIPYIGRFSAARPNWYAATGFGKWGMTSSMVAASIITDQITGKENPNAQVFSPQRFTPGASAGELARNTAVTIKSFSGRLFSIPHDGIDAIENGHGGIVEYEGKKVGVYKDENGQIYTVSTRCPHLGCGLAWNQDELSWDCPCHGSRFDYKGNLIDNPAQEDLRHA